MSIATERRQRRAKKAGNKAGRGKTAAPAPAKRVAARGKDKGERPAAPQGSPARPKPKMRAAPPPVELEIAADVLEFIKAIDDYRVAHDRPFPSWSEVLYVLKQLGYRKP